MAIAHTGGTTERQRAWVAALHAGADALLSGDAALRLLGLPVESATIDVALPAERRVRGARLLVDDQPAAVQRRITAVPKLRATLAQMPLLKRRLLLLDVLDDVELGAHVGSELRFLRFCRARALPLPDVLQVKVRTGSVHYLDARYARQRVTVEVDGSHHKDVATWQADALRSLRLVAAMPGEWVLRLTMGMLRHDGAEVADVLRAILL